MRRYLSHVIATALAALALAVPAQASTIYSSTYEPTAVLFDNQGAACTGMNYEDATPDTVSALICDSLDYGHLLSGYSNPPDTLLGATLKLEFDDDDDPSNDTSNGNQESVIIELNPTVGPYQFVGDITLTNNTTTTLSYSVISQILDDGSLAVLLTLGAQGSGQGDFYFLRSTLTGEWDEGEIQLIPEPASLMLFGSGLALVATRVRRARRRV